MALAGEDEGETEGEAVGAGDAEREAAANGIMLASSVEMNRPINTLFNVRLLAQ
jgi:hypothetical protein